MLVLAAPLRAQQPVERVRCQLLSFRVLQAAKGGLIDPRFLQVFEEGAQRAVLHGALATLPQLEMLLPAADSALVARGELASRIAARAFVTRADIERVDKALTTEYLVSTTVMLEFLNPATGEVYHIQGLTGSTNIRKDAGADLTAAEAVQALGSTLAGTERELATRVRERYRPGVRARVVQQLADGRLALGVGAAGGLREGARLEVRDSAGQVVGVVRVEQAQQRFSVTGRPLADNPNRNWIGLVASSPGLNRSAGGGGFAHLVTSVEQRSELVQRDYVLPQATLIYWLHESLAEAAPGLNFLPPIAAGGLATEQERLEVSTGRAGDIAGQRVIPDFLVRAAISRADALSETGPDGATYYILKVGVDVSFYDLRNGQIFYATYVEGTQQERVRAGERVLDLSVSYRNLLQRTMNDIGRRVAAEYAPASAEGVVREVRPDGSLLLGVTGTGSVPDGGIVTLWADGDEVHDPVTRQPLGRVEEAAARIRIVRVAGATAEALPIGAPVRPLAGGRFHAPATAGEVGTARRLIQVQRVEVRGDIQVPTALLTEIVQTALARSRAFAVLQSGEVLGDLAALRDREFGGGAFSNQAAARLLSAENAEPALYARVVARFLPPTPAQEGGRPAQEYEARLGIALVAASDTAQQAGNAAQALTSRFALPAGRREVVVGLAAQDVAKIYAQMARELAATVVQQLGAAAR
ncbi:MAG: hypothetical protein Q7J79_00150 [Gemmatimonadales bacterium]|nr:hypothetical protein [Gemmatimonadales bacterium]